MKQELKEHKDKDRRIGHYINGEIPVDDDGPQIYIVEGVYQMDMEDEGLVYNVFLIRREGTKSHGQLEWELVSFDENDTNNTGHSGGFHKILLETIEKNHREYKWLN